MLQVNNNLICRICNYGYCISIHFFLSISKGEVILKISTYIALAATTIVAACGGGGGSASSGTTPPTTAAVYTSQYIDAPIKGLNYVAAPSGEHGVTNDTGSFNFKDGDTVTFALHTPNGDIEVGKLIPQTPATGTQAAPISVVTVESGAQLAEIFQSIGGTGSVIDLTSTQVQTAIAGLTTSQITEVVNYVNSGGVTNRPSVLTVTPAAALKNAMNTINSMGSNLASTRASKEKVLATISGKTVVINSALTYPTMRFTLQKGTLVRFNNDNTISGLCINGQVLEGVNAQFTCQPGIQNNAGTWSVANNGQLTINMADSTTFVADIWSADMINVNYTGGYTGGSIPSGDAITEYGSFQVVKDGITSAFYGGKTVTITGESYCSDGKMNFSFTSNGGGYTASCATTTPNRPSFSGTVAYPSELLNVAALTLPDTTKVYLAVANGSGTTSGKVITIRQGSSSCYNAPLQNNISNCGRINPVKYTLQ